MKLNKFVPLEKMEEQSDGTLHVFGIVTAEQPDLENEVCDYETTKALYEKRSAENLAKTSIPGMTPSFMPFREMHQSITQGAGRSLVCDDASKTIRMGFQVVDTEAVKKWKAGCFVGFSQGGAYVKRWDDPDFPGCQRYTADPYEVSAVDAPCLPIALVESMKGRSVQLAKAAGVMETIALKLDKPEEFDSLIEMLKTATAGHVKTLLGAASMVPVAKRKTVLAAAENVGVKLSERDQKAITRVVARKSLAKGLYEVGWLGDLLESLHWLCLQTEFERDMEDDGSKVPEGLRDAWLALIEEFKAMALEEATELAAAGGKGEKAVKITTQEDLTKAAKALSEHLANLKEKHETHGEQMKKAHEAIQERHGKLGEHIEKCMKACKDAEMGDEPEGAEKGAEPTVDDVQKKFDAMEKTIADLTKAHADMVEKLGKTAAGGGAHSGTLETELTKGGAAANSDVPAELAGILNTAPAA